MLAWAQSPTATTVLSNHLPFLKRTPQFPLLQILTSTPPCKLSTSCTLLSSSSTSLPHFYAKLFNRFYRRVAAVRFCTLRLETFVFHISFCNSRGYSIVVYKGRGSRSPTTYRRNSFCIELNIRPRRSVDSLKRFITVLWLL